MKKPKIPQQLISLSAILLLVGATLIAARVILIPKSFGKYGHYRADAVDEISSRPVNYAGIQACADCHDEIYKLKQTSNHKGLSCEVCHGAAAKHAEAPDEVKPNIPRGRGFCPLCHEYNPSRPTGFPQIITTQHNPGKSCMECHNPHSPVPPRTPQDCSACHREISNEKAVSPHVSLACTQCHKVPEQHLTEPRMAAVEKPSTRDFCGECHSQDAKSPAEIPRIDISSHYTRYLCWDCHYPHFPEAK